MARARTHLIVDPHLASSIFTKVHLQTLGACQIQIGAERISPVAETLFSLLVRLVYAPGMQVSRDLLMPSLWPGQGESRQRANLRQALYKLRRMGVLMDLDGDEVRLDHRQVSRTFAVEQSLECFERDVMLGHEPFGLFLPGFTPRGSEMAEWLTSCRETVHADVRRVLAQRLRVHRERADWKGAETMSRWLLQFDPLNEEATLTMAECAALNGSKVEATAIIDRYLQELGPNAGHIRVPAATLRRRIAEPTPRKTSYASADRHFVGREEELSELTQALRRARHGDGSAYLVHGPPGMGKTRLTIELSKVATIEGMMQFRFACRESESGHSMALFLELVSELLQAPGALGCSPDSLKNLRRLIGEEATAGKTGSLRESAPNFSAIRNSIGDLLSAVTDERPVLLVVDDTHWIDNASWDLLVEVLEHVDALRLCIVLTSRHSHAGSTRTGRIPAKLRNREIHALTTDECRRLTTMMLEHQLNGLSGEQELQIASASEGNPLFLRALVDHWVETGSAFGIPPTLAELIDRRLDSLSEQGMRVIQAISLIGQYATQGFVGSVLELPTHACVTVFEELASAGAFVDSPDSVIRCHDLVCQAALNRLSKSSRRLLHERIAGELRKLQDTTAERRLAIASHLKNAGNSDAYLDYVLENSELLLNQGGAHHAIILLEPALSDEVAAGRMHRAEKLWRSALFATGQYSRLLNSTRPDIIERSLSESNLTSANAQEILEIVASIGACSTAPPCDVLTRCLSIAGSDAVAPSLRIEAARLAIEIACDIPDAAAASDAFEAGLRIPADESLSIQRLRLSMIYNAVFGDPIESQRAALEIEHLITKTGDPHQQVSLLLQCGIAFRFAGNYALAEELIRKAMNVKGDVGASIRAAVINKLAFVILDGRNDLNTAWDLAHESRRLTGNSGERLPLMNLAHLRTRLMIESHDGASAIEELRLSAELMSQEKFPRVIAHRAALNLAATRLSGNTASLAEELRKVFTHLPMMRIGQDYSITQILLAMDYLGEAIDHQNKVLRSYLSQRVERGRLTFPLARELRRIESALAAPNR